LATTPYPTIPLIAKTGNASSCHEEIRMTRREGREE